MSIIDDLSAFRSASQEPPILYYVTSAYVRPGSVIRNKRRGTRDFFICNPGDLEFIKASFPSFMFVELKATSNSEGF